MFNRIFTAVLSALLLAACGQAAVQETPSPEHRHAPPPGSNEMLRAPITGAEGLEVIISDVVIPPNATVPRHYHPGEEFLYVIEGSAVHVEEGKPDRELKAGDAYVIPPRAEHAPRGGLKAPAQSSFACIRRARRSASSSRKQSNGAPA